MATLSDRLISVIQAIGADIKKLQNKTPTLPEIDTDPVSPPIGTVWVLRTVINPVGTFAGFIGGYPLETQVDQDKFEFSVQTTLGVRRTELT